MTKNKKALILGASGLTGGELLRLLANSPKFSRIVVLTRKALDYKKMNIETNKIEEHIVDFDSLETQDSKIFQVDILFSCLGTTRKQTPDPKTYKKIEVDYLTTAAKKVLEHGGTSIHYISSIGASSRSLSNYSKIKAEAEEELRTLSEYYPKSSFYIYRPSLILGLRKKERTTERLAILTWGLIDKMLIGPARKYRFIHAFHIAKAMLKKATVKQAGFFILESDEIEKGSI